MRQELDPSHIVQTSDFSGFAGLRVVLRERPKKDGGYESGRRGTPFFMIGYRPGEERGCTAVQFRAATPLEIRLTHVSAVFPPERPFEVNWTGAYGKVAAFEIEPRFLAEVSGVPASCPPSWNRCPPPGSSSTSGSINCAGCSCAKPNAKRRWRRYTLRGWPPPWSSRW